MPAVVIAIDCENMMSVFFAVVLVVITWLLSSLIYQLPDVWRIVWHITAIAPSWCLAIVAVGSIAWFISDS